MTDDQFWRIAITAAAIPLWGWAIQKTKTYLRTKRDETGRSLDNRIAYRLSRLWARANGRGK